MLYLREHQCSQDACMFLGVRKKLSIVLSFWTMVLSDWHLIHLRLFEIDLYQRLRNILSHCTICSYGKYIYHYSDRAATLADLCHTNVLGNVVHTKVTKAAVEFYKARMISALLLLILNQITRQNVLLQLLQTKLLLLR